MFLLWLLLNSAAHSALPTFLEVKAAHFQSDGRLLDRQGGLLQEMRLSLSGRSLEWIPIAEVSPALKHAVVEVEDHRFYEHHGVDFWAVGGAIWQNLRGEKRGASTITMQVLKFLESDLRGRRTLWDKVRQARLAQQLETTWTKNEILEVYLNLVSFRGEFRGVAAASRALFQKDPHGLEEKESYILAALLRSPGSSKETLAARLCVLAREKPNLGNCEEWKGFLSQQKTQLPRRANFAPHLAHKLLTLKQPLVKSSVDADLQKQAQLALEEQMQALKSQNVRDAAVLVLENKTGNILAYVGGASTSASAAVDMATSLRQAGSTLKPFLYAAAFEKGFLTPESWLVDEPFEMTFERGSYRPENYDHSFRGPVRAKEALAASLNIPAVKVVDLLGVENFHQKLELLGFESLESAEHYGPSLALGTADVALIDLVNAYRTIANEGIWQPISWLGQKGKAHRVYSAESMRMITEILSDRGNRAITFGWDSVLATPFPSAVKTGTSKDMRDNWCVGFTKKFTVGVWVGNAQGDSMHQVSGVSGAAPIWRAVIDRLPKSSEDFARSKRLVQESELVQPNFAKIQYPQDGAILALDPDIPDANEWVPLEAVGDGKFLVDGSPALDRWQPKRGKHRISLVDANGKTLDEVKVLVR